jgi:hypothetical protein
MDPRNRVTDAEWDALAAGPAAAISAMMSTSRPGVVGVVKEALAGGKATRAVPTDGEAGELISALMAYASDHDELVKAYEPKDEDDLEATRAAGLTGVERAGAAATKLTPAEADGYATWLVGIARAMAEATPDKDASEAVSEAEAATITEIERRLRRS